MCQLDKTNLWITNSKKSHFRESYDMEKGLD